MPAPAMTSATTCAARGEANRVSYPMNIPRWACSCFRTYQAIAPATRRTLSNVKSSAMSPRQPSVPNLISCAMNDSRHWPVTSCHYSYCSLITGHFLLHQLMHLLLVQILHDLAHILSLLSGRNQQRIGRLHHN